MRDGLLARRYGRAIFELALETDGLISVGKGFSALKSAMAAVSVLIISLSDERVRMARRLAVASEIASLLKLGATTRKLFLLLVSKGRLDILPLVAKDFEGRVARHEGMICAEVSVAGRPYSERLKQNLEEILCSAMKTRVSCSVGVDQDILAGFVLRMGDLVYDASVKGRLKGMEERFLNGN